MGLHDWLMFAWHGEDSKSYTIEFGITINKHAQVYLLRMPFSDT